jgi:hypothetical protein
MVYRRSDGNIAWVDPHNLDRAAAQGESPNARDTALTG